jgi:hypothetical protein
MRERRVDVERLLGDLRLALRLEGAERPQFSACFSSREVKLIWPIFVTPSTSVATSGPKSSPIWSSVASVSSTVSCRSPVTTLGTSSRISAMMPATFSGWVRYGSPEARRCPLCTSAENA